MKILLVDDERGLLEQAKIFLERENESFQVETVASAEEALDIFEEEEYDVIVSDYQMPGIDGIDFLKELREELETDIPFIMFTGKGREEVAIEALNLGADRYIQKGGAPKSQYEILADAINQEYEHHQSEKKYKTLVENSHDAIYIYRDNEFLFVNERFSEITGYEKKELLDMDVMELIPESETEKIKDIGKKRGTEDSPPSKYETKIVTKAGEIKNLQVAISSIEHRGQEAFLGSARDITRRKRLQEERKEYIDDLKFIQETVVKVSGMNKIDKICDHIAEKISSFEAADVMIFLNDRETAEIELRSIYGSERFEGFLEECLDGDLTSLSIEDDEKFSQIYQSGDLDHVTEGLFEPVQCHFSEEKCEDIIGFLETKEPFTIGFAMDNAIFGGLTIFKPEDAEIEHKNAIETLSSHLSVLLDKKQDEKKLRLSDISRDQASLEIYWITPGGRFIFTNETVNDRLGYSKEEMKDMYVWDVDPNHGKNIRKDRWEKLKEEKVLSFESEHKTLEGEAYPVKITSHYIEFRGEEYEFAYAEKISEKKEKERKLKERKNWLSQIVEGVSVPLFVIDEDHKVTNWNKVCERLTGLDKEEVIGTEDPWKAFYEEERPVMADLVLENADEDEVQEYYGDKFEESSLLEEAYEAEDFFPRVGEEGRYFYFTASPIIDSDGNRVGAIETLQDVTERRKTEKKLEEEHERLITLIHNIPGITYRCIKDENWTMKFLTEGVKDLTGYEKEALIDNEEVAYGEIIHPEDREHVRSQVEKAVENDQPFKVEYRIVTSSDEEKWVWERGRAVDPGDGHEMLEGIILDMTDKKEAEERRDFLGSIIRHDVQNKLQLAKGYVELMKEEPDKSLDYADKVYETLKKGDEIIEKVRKLDKIEKETVVKEVELSNIVDRIISEYDVPIKDSDIKIEVENVMGKVKGGPILHTLFSNLIENAIVHADCDTIKINVQENADEHIVTIEDDGVGIPGECKDKLFDRGYKRGENAGTGLGLYLAKRIAESYDGSIEVKDSDLGGARFDIHLKKA